jgi:hypothetical protein
MLTNPIFADPSRSPEMEAVRLLWRAAETPPELQAMLRLLGQEYPLAEAAAAADADAGLGGGCLAVAFEHDPGLAGYASERRGEAVRIRYGRLSQVGRALGSVLAGLLPDGASVSDAPAFTTLGILLDCGHNATVTTEHFRTWLRRLALLGYNTAMIYTEAGYILPEEPCFGYMRGAYSAAEMRELDDYAATLGIEMIGSIQALGHLEQVLAWPPYGGIRDTEHTLLVGEPKTYELVEKMVAYWSSVFRSRRFHLGMDETYDLGRGRYLDRHGHRRGLELYTEHLRRVTDICAQHGLRPLIWSDVLFRLASTSGAHYAQDSRIPDAVREALPKDLDLAYWDYYNEAPAHYQDRIRQHRTLGFEPVMTSAVWSWPTPWHDWRRTERCGGACVDACREAGVKEMIFALWSDDGAYWELDSALAGLTLVAEKCYGDGTVDAAVLARRFRAICGSDLAGHRLASRLNDRLQACSVLWDDPLLAIYLRHVAKTGTQPLRDAETHYREVVRELEPRRADRAAGDLNHAWLVAGMLAAKTGLAARLFDAYAVGDRAALAGVREAALGLVPQIEALARSFRTLWLARCQPFGLEVLQIRFAGQAARYRELADRLGEYLDGQVTTIPELDEARKGAYLPARSLAYRGLATGARVF